MGVGCGAGRPGEPGDQVEDPEGIAGVEDVRGRGLAGHRPGEHLPCGSAGREQFAGHVLVHGSQRPEISASDRLLERRVEGGRSRVQVTRGTQAAARAPVGHDQQPHPVAEPAQLGAEPHAGRCGLILAHRLQPPWPAVPALVEQSGAEPERHWQWRRRSRAAPAERRGERGEVETAVRWPDRGPAPRSHDGYQLGPRPDQPLNRRSARFAQLREEGIEAG